jgi:hypothetical protein
MGAYIYIYIYIYVYMHIQLGIHVRSLTDFVSRRDKASGVVGGFNATIGIFICIYIE